MICTFFILSRYIRFREWYISSFNFKSLLFTGEVLTGRSITVSVIILGPKDYELGTKIRGYSIVREKWSQVVIVDLCTAT